MTLTLEILGPPAVENRKQIFDETMSDGIIGRAASNWWVLPDDSVSARHAMIRYEGGRFSIEDLGSTNHTYVNEKDVFGSGPRYLESADTITIGPYRIHVTVNVSARDQPRERPVPLDEPATGVQDWERELFSDESTHGASEPAPSASDPDRGELHGVGPEPTAAPQSQVVDGQHSDFPEAPAWTSLEDDAGPRPGQDDTAEATLAAILASAGLRGVDLSKVRASELGRILRVVVSGLRDLLDARQQLKRHFGMTGTMIERGRNNPLKFSATADEALRRLLIDRDDAYLEPLAAFEQAFNDLRNHQVAELEGMKAAYWSMLGKFDAQGLQRRFEKQVEVSTVFPVPSPMAKLRYWDLYRQWFEELKENPDSFRDLFGRDFVRAYEEFVQAYEKRRDRAPDKPRRDR